MVSALETAFRSYVRANPKPSDANNWDQQCAKGQYRFNKWLTWLVLPQVTGPGAVHVAKASGQLNKDWTKAPIGAWHYWSVGVNGHVGQDLAGGGTRIGMFGTAKLSVSLAPFVGISSIAKYGSSTYLGWALNYGGGRSKIPPEPAASEWDRIIGPEGAYRRSEAKRVPANVLHLLEPGRVVPMVGYVLGESVEGINRWFVTTSGAYVWAGGTTNPRVGTLPNRTPVTTPTPDPVVVTPPPTPPVVEVVDLVARSQTVEAQAAWDVVGLAASKWLETLLRK